MRIARTELVTLVGLRGSGKSTLAKALAVELARERPVLILDPWNDWPDIVAPYEVRGAGVARRVLSGARAVRLMSSNPRDARALLKLAWELDDCLLVLDEADLVLRNGPNLDAFQRLVHYGRHFGQGAIVVARRPSQLPRDFTAQGVLCFPRTQEPRDRQWLRERLGDWPPELKLHPKLGPHVSDWALHDAAGNLEIVGPDFARGILERAGKW